MSEDPSPNSYFDEMFRQSDDPWGFRSRWYEARKRALTVACLPAIRYVNGYEPGCANGELSAVLAGRCDRLLVSDSVHRAVELARTRLAAFPHVRVVHAHLPEEWPDELFDIIAISELGYFLSEHSLDAVAIKARDSLISGGTVLACHWRRPIEGCSMTGDQVHERLARVLELPALCEVREADFVLHVWSSDPSSVAQREGFDW